jgi:hypothetical protein
LFALRMLTTVSSVERTLEVCGWNVGLAPIEELTATLGALICSPGDTNVDHKQQL